MALFSSVVSKQSAFGARVATVAVYYVHSHLQYTSACSTAHEQVRKNCLENTDFFIYQF